MKYLPCSLSMIIMWFIMYLRASDQRIIDGHAGMILGVTMLQLAIIVIDAIHKRMTK